MNVLVLLSDQHNPKAAGFAGDPVALTPHLDALAAAGTTFTAAYTPSPICVPARAAWATGRWVHRIGCWDNATAYAGDPPGWAHALQDQHVPVESIGKLHYVDAEAPTGFDRQIEPMHLAGGIGQVWGSVRDPLPRKVGAPFLVSFSGAGESDYTRYDRRTTSAACRWLEARAERGDEPWVLHVGFVAPHHPYLAPRRFFDLYDPDALPTPKLHPLDGHDRHPWVAAYGEMLPGLDMEASAEDRRRCLAAYYGLVSFLDDNVGAVLDALERTGMADDTLVVVTSDHGDTMGSRGLWGKSVLYEESAGVPLVLRGPGVPAGGRCGTPTGLVDGYVSVLHAAGVPVPDAYDGPGRSWLDLATEPDDPERVMFSEYHAMGAPSAAFLVRKGRWKLHRYVGDYEPELFDLESDPEEISSCHADPGCAAVLADLDAELHRILDPEAVDRAAKADQAALVERFGGPTAAAELGTVAETPAPDETARS